MITILWIVCKIVINKDWLNCIFTEGVQKYSCYFFVTKLIAGVKKLGHVTNLQLKSINNRDYRCYQLLIIDYSKF